MLVPNTPSLYPSPTRGEGTRNRRVSVDSCT